MLPQAYRANVRRMEECSIAVALSLFLDVYEVNVKKAEEVFPSHKCAVRGDQSQA